MRLPRRATSTFSAALFPLLVSTLAGCATDTADPDMQADSEGEPGSEGGSDGETGSDDDLPAETGSDDDLPAETGGATATGGPAPTGDTSGGPGGSDESGAVATCGDGIVEGDEFCDDAELNGEYGHCAQDCAAPGDHCGDGQRNGQEACDDGNNVSGDGCSAECFLPGTRIWGKTLMGPWGDPNLESISGEDAGVVVGVNYYNADEDYGYTPVLTRFEADGTEAWQIVEDLGTYVGARVRQVIVNRQAVGEARLLTTTGFVSYENNSSITAWRGSDGKPMSTISSSGDHELAAIGHGGQAALGELYGDEVLYVADPGDVDSWWSLNDLDLSLRDLVVEPSGDVVAAFKDGGDDVILQRLDAADGSPLAEYAYRVYLTYTSLDEMVQDGEGHLWVIGDAGDVGYLARFDPNLEPGVSSIDSSFDWDHIAVDDDNNVYVGGRADYEYTVRKYGLDQDGELELLLEIPDLPNDVEDLAVDGVGDIYVSRQGFEQLEKYAG